MESRSVGSRGEGGAKEVSDFGGQTMVSKLQRKSQLVGSSTEVLPVGFPYL